MEVKKNNPELLLEEVEKAEDEKEHERLINQYIFDEDKILKTKVFSQCKINQHLFAYGLFLPKETKLTDKQDRAVGKDQIWSPVLITSKGKMLEITKEIELKYKIKFEVLPSHNSLHWSLGSIKDYLDGDYKTPEISPRKLFEKIKNKYEESSFFKSPTWYKINSLWDGGTYVFMLFDNYPIKEERGLRGTGKSKVMKISRNISFNATNIMINPSESTLFRETHDLRPTKYIDEAEKLFSFKKGKLESDNRVELINGSYSKGSTIPRMEKIGNRFFCVYYDVYSPTRVGSINGLFGATEDRSITQIHTKNLDNDPRGEMEPQEDDPDFQIIRDYLYLFGLKYWKEIEKVYRDNSLYENLKLKKRDLQIWRPLLALAKIVGDDWFNEVVEFAERLSLQRKEDFLSEDSWDYRILSIIKEILSESREIIRPKEIKKRYGEKFSNESEKLPHEKTIINRLDQLGFKELRQPRDREGNFYRINKENFHIIVSPISNLSDFPTFATQSSQSYINKEKCVTESNNSVKESDGNVLRSVKICDGNVANEGNVANPEKDDKLEVVKVE